VDGGIFVWRIHLALDPLRFIAKDLAAKN